MASEKAARGATFVVTAERCPQVLCRLIGLVAQQGRMLTHLDAVDTRRILRVSLSVEAIEPHQAAIVAEKMRQIVRVRTVRLGPRRGPRMRTDSRDDALLPHDRAEESNDG